MLIADEADKQMNPLVIRYVRFIRYQIRCQPAFIASSTFSQEILS
jgi:hypothetical protein